MHGSSNAEASTFNIQGVPFLVRVKEKFVFAVFNRRNVVEGANQISKSNVVPSYADATGGQALRACMLSIACHWSAEMQPVTGGCRRIGKESLNTRAYISDAAPCNWRCIRQCLTEWSSQGHFNGKLHERDGIQLTIWALNQILCTS